MNGADVLSIDTTEDVQLFLLRDLFDDAASEHTGALIINGRAEGSETELPGSYSHDAPRDTRFRGQAHRKGILA